MRSMKAVLATFVLVAVLAEGHSAEAAPPPLYQPNCGETVNFSFRLQADLDCSAFPGSDGIVLGASSITLDLNRQTITGNGGAGIRAAAGRTNILIKGLGTVRGFTEGIVAPSKSLIDSVVVANNDIGIRGAFQSTIQNSMLSSNGTGYWTGSFGSAPSAVLNRNRIVANDFGVIIDDGPQTQIFRNWIIGNLSTGVWLKRGAGFLLLENDISGNGQTELGDPGVRISAPVTDSSIESNAIDGNGAAGVIDQGTGNTIRNNKVRGNGFMIDRGGDAGLVLTNPSDASRGNFVLGNEDPGCDPASICSGTSKAYYKTKIIMKNGVKKKKRVQEVFPLQTPACGTTVTASFRLAQDIECPDTWITVQGDNITVDLNGHTVTGPLTNGELPIEEPPDPEPDPYPTGVFVEADIQPEFRGPTGTRIRNGAIRGFYFGVDLTGRNARVYDLVLADNNQGVTSNFTDGGLIETNVMAANQWGHNDLLEFSPTTVRQNRVLGNGMGLVFQSGPGQGPTVTANVVGGNGLTGISITPDDGLTLSSSVVKSNLVYGNGHLADPGEDGPAGIWLAEGVVDASVSLNELVGNADHGYIDAGQSNDTIQNVALANGFVGTTSDGIGVGLYMGLASQPTLSGNTSLGNDAANECVNAGAPC